MFQAQVLLPCAQLIPGISTPHYFYINETIGAVLKNAPAAKSLWDKLSAIPGHADLLHETVYASYEHASAGPEEFLLRLSQSSSYLLKLPNHPRLVPQMLSIFAAASGKNYPKSFDTAITPVAQLSSYQPASLNIGRFDNQWMISQVHYASTASLLPPQDSIVDLFDTTLPHLHWLFGSLMLLGSFATPRTDRNSLKAAHAAYEHCLLFFDNLLGHYEWLHSRFHIPQPTTAPTTAVATLPPFTTGTVKIGLAEGQEYMNIMHILLGLDTGLGVAESILQVSPATQLAWRMVTGMRTNYSRPLLDTIAANTDAANLLISRDKTSPEN